MENIVFRAINFLHITISEILPYMFFWLSLVEKENSAGEGFNVNCQGELPNS
jgi:hypothetical protein